MSHWTDHYFQTGYIESLPEKHYTEVASRQSCFFLEWSGHPQLVLDVGCADGRLSVPLARLGARVTGLDRNPDYLRRGRQYAQAQGVGGVAFIQGDFYSMDVVTGSFDAALLYGSVLGYRERADDLQMPSHIHHLLGEGGCVVIETDGYEWLMSQAPTRHWYAGRNGWYSLAHFTQRDAVTGKIKMDHIFLQASTGREETASVYCWLYTAHDLTALLRQAGFCDFEVVGPTGLPFTPADSRMLVRGWKKRPL